MRRLVFLFPCLVLTALPAGAQPVQAIYAGQRGSIVPVPNGWAESPLATAEGLVGEVITCADGARAVVGMVATPVVGSPATTAEAICEHAVPSAARLLSSNVPCKTPYTLVRRYQWGGEQQAHFEVVAVKVGSPESAVYMLGAPATTFNQDVGTLASIWERSRLIPAPGYAAPVEVAADTSVTHEEESAKAFSVQTPPGWTGHVTTLKGGGSFAHLFTFVNADKTALILFEQPYPVLFMPPNAQTQAKGWQPGSVHEVNGVRVMLSNYLAPGDFMQSLVLLDPDFKGLQIGEMDLTEPAVANGQTAWIKIANPALGMSGEVRCTTVNLGQSWTAYFTGWVAKPGAEAQAQAQQCFAQAVTTFKIDPAWAARNVPNSAQGIKDLQASQARLRDTLRRHYPNINLPAAPATGVRPSLIGSGPSALRLGHSDAQATVGQVCALDAHHGKRPVLSGQGVIEYVSGPTPPGMASLSVTP